MINDKETMYSNNLTSIHKLTVNKTLQQYIREAMIENQSNNSNDGIEQDQTHFIYSNRQLKKIYVSTGTRIKTFTMSPIKQLDNQTYDADIEDNHTFKQMISFKYKD